jgi:hypothetical protein
LTDVGQNLDQLPKPILSDVPEAALMLLGDDIIELIDKTLGLPRNPGSNLTPVLAFTCALDESALFHTVEKPRHIGHPGEQSLAELVPAESIGLGATEDSQNVELRGRDTVRLEHTVERIDQQRSSPDNAELGLLVDAPEGLLLMDLVT